MKDRLIILIIAIFACSTMTFAHVEGDVENTSDKPLEVVLAEIRAQQDIGEDERIDPEKVSDEQLEALGDALMSVMHPDPREHEWMDDMMGGEGSTTLSSMHRIMGYNYLRGYYGGMMGPGMMGQGMMSGRSAYDPLYRGHSMMNTSYGNVFFWVIILIVVVAVIYFIVQTRKGRIAVSSEETPLNILAKRYAKGELTRDDYERMKKDIS